MVARGRASVALRVRPQISTTVAVETDEVVRRLSGGDARGDVLDALVWCGVRQRLAYLFDTFCSGPDVASWRKPSAGSSGVDRVLFGLLIKEWRRFTRLGPEERLREVRELQVASDTRVSVGRLSPLDDVVRLFVAWRMPVNLGGEF